MKHREMNYTEPADPRLYGLMAEFTSPEQLLRATERVHELGYRRIDAFSPAPIHGLSEALGFHHTRVSLVVLIGGLTGAVSGYALQYYMAALAYVHNTGGKPVHSWPAFIPITFELTVLFGALSAVIGMIVMNRLPRPYHPVFNVPRFALASDDRFFLCIEAHDPKFELNETRRLLQNLDAYEVTEVDA